MHKETPYAAGQQAAEKDLGLHPVTPPPSWTHGRKVTVPSATEKKAFMAHDRLPGGPADKMRPSDFDQKELRKGQRHEMEHTNSPALAKEIASDHIAEIPNYYEKILKVEKK